ncbi:RagB/SusD family nutrient uptake outer membrane protein [Sphingobacterium humi]|uniref:RagB/SusD family nutrient uptake outer membrane protein n=1 Tax=Sphingobacterium humi TaxID=1796905 RepID=A0A6N8KV30_9SPHI|nr:RagB/SusD family nutrient uptake outer membrane protein [Sphingobacterium humi]MVZ60644.1 RagB/SusD family nutrient uptake outer membrane protein [Sphingobacterium humi]
MKLQHLSYAAALFLMSLTSSCNKYLDIVPEGKPTVQDIYKTQVQTQNYVYTLYGSIPDRVHLQAFPDLAAGGDFISGYYGAPRYFTYKSLLYGLESSSSTYYGFWSTVSAAPEGVWRYNAFKAIRNCYNLLKNIESVPDITEENKRYWSGEAYFLIAYYHQLLLEYYGPIVLIKDEISQNAEGEEIYLKRRPYDECVDFIVEKYNTAAGLLPARWGNDDIGRATAATALGQKARLLLYAASPLVNGNAEFYANFKNKDGEQLIPIQEDRNKWQKAMVSAKEAIDYCESNGYKLYTSSTVAGSTDMERGTQNYYATFVGEGTGTFLNTDEILFGSGNQSSLSYTLKNIAPRVGLKSYSNDGFRGYLIPTWDCIEMYYSKNGLPMNVDPLTKDLDLYSVAPGDNTALLNRNREPRFYASIGFDRGSYKVNGGVITLMCRRGEPQQNDGNPNNPYQSDNGYYAQKWISKLDTYNTTSKAITASKYIFPYLRLAELYLSYAEADFEFNGSLSQQSLTYLNKVRNRAGLPNFEASWSLVGGIPTGQTLRNVIRQERSIEFLMEGRRFHDIRRWKIAHIEMMRTWKSWNLAGKTQEEFYSITNMQEGDVRVFESPKSYWLAIPIDQLNTNHNLVQNPGY